jgi:hypothetical protein
MVSRPVAATVAVAAVLPILIVALFLAAGGGMAAPAPAAGVPVAPAAGIGKAAGATAGANQALGDRLAAGYGWAGTGPGGQLTCLRELWTRESGWRNTAINPASGAYGIAQALGHAPGATLAQNRSGDNYPPAEAAANPPPWGDSDPAAQITWGLGYIASAYRTPCQAWAHEVADGFY